MLLHQIKRFFLKCCKSYGLKVAKRKKLSKDQTRRITANHQKRLKQAKQQTDTDILQWQDDNLGAQQHARVVSRFGQHADVETNEGE